jgi:hypothetical protein
VRPDRIVPVRVLRVERVLRWLRVSGTLEDPVRVEPLDVRVLAVLASAPAALGPAFAGVAAAAASAIPQTSQ